MVHMRISKSKAACPSCLLVMVLLVAQPPIASSQATLTINERKSSGQASAAAAQVELDDFEVVKRPPVIGVLTQVLRDYKRFSNEHKLHLVSSYVKWLESAGAQVIPVLLNQNESYYEEVFKQTNGLLFPGGDNLLDPSKRTPMMVAAKRLYKLAVEANDRGEFYPIWGTCLGLELLSVLSANRNVLEKCSAVDEALAMDFVGRGKLFTPSSYANLPMLDKDYSGAIVGALSSQNLTYNYHTKCLTDAGMKRAGLDKFYRPLAYSSDKNNLKFITIFESINYPFFGVQFHPEKPPFEFVSKVHQLNIPHSKAAVAVSRYFADFFVQQAQRNRHLIDRTAIQDKLIYANNPTYTAPLLDMYEQRYLFPFQEDPSNSDEEFIDHIPADNEEVPEEVKRARQMGAETTGTQFIMQETKIVFQQLDGDGDGGLMDLLMQDLCPDCGR